MRRYEFHLRIAPHAYLDFYRGVARVVVATADSGESIQFPASLLRRFVTDGGIDGHFALTIDANNKCVDLQRTRG
jgi:hypothetical protein